MAKHTLPPDWNQKVLSRMEEIRGNDPTKNIFGLVLPSSWRSSLATFHRSGELCRLFKVKAITFYGSSIERLEPPKSV